MPLRRLSSEFLRTNRPSITLRALGHNRRSLRNGHLRFARLAGQWGNGLFGLMPAFCPTGQ